MNAREQYLNTMLFDHPDRIPFQPGGGRKSTLEAWHSQGLPAHIQGGKELLNYACEQAGIAYRAPIGGTSFVVQERMIPMFEEKVIEVRDRSQVVQDWKGNICEIGKEFTVEYLRNAMDFVTRRWIKCPVETRADWEEMKRRYNPDDASRLPQNPEALGKQLKNRDYPIRLSFSGPFWQLREWLGFENLCMLFHDDPDFVRDMIAFWEDYIARLLKKALAFAVPDTVLISEDMAYKSFSMISPKMVRDFILPTWTRWGEIIHGAGCPVYDVDSDGFVGELIPLWIESGLNSCCPIEVAAGNDLVEYRRKFGRQMAYTGGVDKRAMAKGGRVIEAEIKRLEPVIRSGGYIPSCDHGIPPDVSWPNFVYYVKLLAKVTGWA
ncbi:MAG: hypothetical protein KKG09_10285 [Verrucomicrobia bacterium]|nr:hypothetical protein [Verrucomicrobiota bacterium]MCG2681852.1 hypothetical protein [Kiritimatiellia bacterium]MBU4247731.1 hypothetical protein [Verrucomicrobiota bacterium]MBU4291617.1 hypothetical protein [Verrucomicrobiota bacterium]MBU4429566.1 hypothetical protein [Verrucomicrobiota bacterium]